MRKSQVQPKLTGFLTRKPKANDDEKTSAREPEKRQLFQLDDSPIKTTPSKRKRVILSSDDEAENQRPSTPQQRDQTVTPKSSQRKAGQMSASFINSFRYDENETLDDMDVSSITSRTPSRTPSRTASRASSSKFDQNDDEPGMLHLTFDFLKEDKLKDKEGRRPSDPDYDPRTLHVPKEFLNKQTPGHQQWWKLKMNHFDTVLFFKVGKFYEMYHGDAVIGLESLGLKMMRGKYAHTGFPEMAFGSFADKLIRKGYKVARIEQTETPAQLEERCKGGKKEKVVRRELCQITSQATKTYDGPTEENSSRPDFNYLLSICEKKSVEDGPTKTRFGISFIDCTIGQFNLCEFVDDGSYSTLRTLLAHNQPSQVLVPRAGLSKSTRAVINSILGPVSTEELKKKTEFLSASDTLKLLLDVDYNFGSNVREWPEALSNTVADLDEPIPKPKSDYELALSSLGAICWYLKNSLIDVDMITMKKFETYIPANAAQSMSTLNRWEGRRMILDGLSLRSLHLLPPNDILSGTKSNVASLDKDGKTFSLFNTVDHCLTHFGRRLFRVWVCAPSCDPDVLSSRQESIKYLCKPEAKSLMETANDVLKKTPDLERLFQRIHSIGLKFRNEKHPDARAQFFDLLKYNGKKVKDLCLTLSALEKLHSLIVFFGKNFKNDSNCPTLLKDCLGNEFTDMVEDLKHFNQLIVNRDKAAKEGKIVPPKGMDPIYDESLEDVANAVAQLEEYLREEKKTLKSNKLSYTGTGKNRYQLEIPEELTDTLSSDYELKSKRKGFKRYRTPKLEELIQNLTDMEKIRDKINDDSTRRVFADFDERKNKWAKIVNQIAIFDCIRSLSCYASQSPLPMCTPEFDFTSPQPYLKIEQGYHPSLASGSGILSSNASEYIPNDTILGESTPPVLLLTGANMGGKSTLMRQTAVLTVLAQIGSLVPAKSMRLTPVDRIFSRIGASDCLAAGQSTFFVELDETNTILRESSMHSLVIIDELGRGTSTFDGTAIASAVLKNLVEKVKCRTLFSTHYHSLSSKFEGNPGISLGHMSCLVENDDLNGDPSMDNVTFLYTLASGPAPKSYGFFTARIAGIDPEIVRRAYQASKMIESNGNEQALQKLQELTLAVKENRISDEDLMTAIKGA